MCTVATVKAKVKMSMNNDFEASKINYTTVNSPVFLNYCCELLNGKWM